ncbi:YopJ family acetyltransferase [Xenorhabdus sp. XENO-10]|uniref:YopJ family acetyltransferase n=1 Tax=Xenorhabdus yunnanensis TaxID=3025878 RepID=A0ABT5LDW7_9GAMM|nr:YopJ family acetyltransferase [Xenorhabdus yunnanensis]MDC9589149.1 YopJ family acetyltransferase [Xenorhabdus yunnanensis]
MWKIIFQQLNQIIMEILYIAIGVLKMLAKDSLNKYIEKAQSNKQNDIQFNDILVDMSNCEIILRHFNSRYPDMNSHPTIMNVNDFIKNIKDSPPNNNERKLFIVNAGGDRTHFATANVFKDMNDKISIIFVDSSLGRNQHILFALYLNFKDASNIKTLYIYNQIQNSNGDCLLFSLHFLKKMHKHRNHFVKLHQDLFNDRIRFIREKNTTFNPPEELSDDYLEKAHVVFFDQAIKLLPIDFFKHAHSKTPINAYLENHPDETSKKVNKWKGGETLIDRYNRHKVIRTIDGKQRTYSSSIEEKRLSLAQAALRWLGE